MALNKRLLTIAVSKKAEPILKREVEELMRADFESKKEAFLDEFDNHPVTKELKGGPTAYSSVPELVAAGGNLFAFLGFDKDKDPAGALRDYLEKTITFKRPGRGVTKGQRITYTGQVLFPTVEDVDAAMAKKMPLKWIGRAFTHMIKNGIPGLPSFLFREDPPFNSPKPSRSSTGVQTKSELRSGGFKGTPYIGPLLGFLKAAFASRRSKR